MYQSQQRKEEAQSFWDGEKVPTPILTSDGCQGNPPIIQDLKAKDGTNSVPPDLASKASPLKASTPPRPSSPVQVLALVQPPTLPCSFVGVMACLQMLELVEVALELSLGTMPIGVMAAPGNIYGEHRLHHEG